MATTVAAAFATLKRNLEITSLQAETVSTRQSEVRDAMEAGLSVLDSFLTGSYAKNTLIAPLARADIDIFIVLAPEYYQRYSPRDLLVETRKVLRLRYPRTPEISPDGQAVTIEFNDFKVDVVPSFYRNGGGFLIGDADKGQWIATDPKVHLDLMTRANSQHSGNLIPLIKMLKGWIRTEGGVLRGFYLELLAVGALNGVTISNFPSGIRWLFDKGRETVRYTIQDPAGFGDQVRGLRGVSVEQAVALFEGAYRKAILAEALERRGLVREAIETWRSIFGDYFPAYG